MKPVVHITALLLVAGCADDGGRPADPGGVDRDSPQTQPSPTTPQPSPTPTMPLEGGEPRPGLPNGEPSPAPRDGSAEAVVRSVTDGDTIRLRGGARVRLVQVDTPEVRGNAECGGRAASAALERQLPPGTRVRLVVEPASDRVDRYGRLLRYVFVGDRNVNVWLVQQGHAAPYFYDGERGRFATQLERAARDARAARRGIWGSCPDALLDPSRGLDTGPARGADG